MSSGYYSVIFISWLVIAANFISATDPTVGLLQNEPDSFIGYTLYTPKLCTGTYLIDNNGLLINQWQSDYTPSACVYLLENGNIFRATGLPDPAGGGGGFQEISWTGEVLWEYVYGTQHHDIEPMPNGNVLLITNDIKEYDELIAAGRDSTLIDDVIRSLTILEIARNDTGGGDIVWAWNAWDHLIQDYDSTKPDYGVVADHPELIDLNFAEDGNSDWIHPNSIDYNPDFDQVMVSCRGFSELWVIDHSTTTDDAAKHSGGNSGKGGDILYRWGNPRSYSAGDLEDQQLFSQHSVCWIEPGMPGAGNILIFNNGLDRPAGVFSSVVEITTPVDAQGNYPLLPDSAFAPLEPVWIYIAETPEDFYSPKFSSAQRFPNGNTLICSGVGGKFFEIDSLGNTVWQYISPVTPSGPVYQGATVKKNDVYSCIRYAPDYPGLAGKDLTPGDPIELYVVGLTESLPAPRKFALHHNYPNPFNPVTSIRYDLPAQAFVRIRVFDLLGKEIAVLVNGTQEAGYQSVRWYATDRFGQPVSAGVYLYQIQAGEFSQTYKMVLLK
ncbi:MAG: aryl-sulfate sulfotransferase [Candidatus Neomarinimicrobiota bacterium]